MNNYIDKTKFRKEGGGRGLLGKETKGGEGILKDEGLEILGEFGISASENEAEFFTCYWVSVDCWQRFSKTQLLVSLSRIRHFLGFNRLQHSTLECERQDRAFHLTLFRDYYFFC